MNNSIIDIPFFSQIPNWYGEESGFPSRQEEDYWALRGCGIACARMVTKGLDPISKLNDYTYWEWIQNGIESNAYCSRGWIHKGISDLVGRAEIKGECFRRAKLKQLVKTLENGNICIVSVSVGFQGGKETARRKFAQKGGHLVVALRNSNGGIMCHHPSSYNPWNWQSKFIPYEAWESSFSGNYISFHPI